MARKKQRKNDTDDTPRQFKRMMELREKMNRPRQSKPDRPASHPKHAGASERPAKREEKAQQPAKDAPPKLEIKKGESMADFSRRVDAAIPLPKARGGDSRKTIKNAKKHKTKAENLRAEYKQRLDAKRRKQEEADDENLDVEDDGEDIWASVNAKAKRPKFGEVADRPPELPKLKSLSSVPKSAGSMARRQILEVERQKVIDHYRKIRGTIAGDEPARGEASGSDDDED